MAEWWNKNKSLPLENVNFQTILDFYLFHCPSETVKGSKKKGTKTYQKVSQRATSLRMQGWIAGHLNTLLSSMKHTTSGHLEYCTFNVDAKIEKEVKILEKDTSMRNKHFEMIVFMERSDMSKTSAIFYYIRNAFAHGSFSIVNANGKKVYYLESDKDGIVKAQIRLREETLLNWIKTFRLSPAALKKALEDGRKQRKSIDRKKDDAA